MSEKEKRNILIEKINAQTKIDKKLLKRLPYQYLKNMCYFDKKSFQGLNNNFQDIQKVIKTTQKYKLCKFDFIVSILCLISGAYNIPSLIKNFSITTLILTSLALTSSIFLFISSMDIMNKFENITEDLAYDLYFNLEQENKRIIKNKYEKLIFPELN